MKHKITDLNGYDLSRDWFDWCFENTDLITPTHTAMYFFIIEHWNRLGQKQKFGLPMEMTKDALGIKNYKTYSKVFNDIANWGFIQILQKSKNQYSANVIALVKNTKPNTKALTKASLKHVPKQVQSIVGIDKPYNHITNNTHKEINVCEKKTVLSFDEFWELYDKKVGNKSKLRSKWEKIPEPARLKILEHVKLYKESTTEKRFRKDPQTYINNQSWNDEIINRNGTSSTNIKNNTGGFSRQGYDPNNGIKTTELQSTKNRPKIFSAESI